MPKTFYEVHGKYVQDVLADCCEFAVNMSAPQIASKLAQARDEILELRRDFDRFLRDYRHDTCGVKGCRKCEQSTRVYNSLMTRWRSFGG